MPISLPLTVGIQSQPTVAWKVGLSAPSIPPLKSVLSRVFSLTMPGFALQMILTANTFFCPTFSNCPTSKCPFMYAPSILPTYFPFRKISAFQSMPSKLRITVFPLKSSGTINSFLYQKAELKKDSEILFWSLAYLMSGTAPILKYEDNTVEGTVAMIQDDGLNPILEISSPLAETSEALCSFQEPPLRNNLPSVSFSAALG